ncbi:CYFA0S18e01310g1_1 [Cyberlindnera fabianii]|uniref:CYFA0S18e01310g1_1 n=1 Tax=Cyberlindnera fabianii TaxID=36022 RepID=A0A061B6B3_CYBFA|nr:hypothetical protein BON22_1124 [Cyberlindnera fabianii]CDR45414.1 CYFA0S18e01310g1_1 [Cyberlindnera fabianii]
MNYSIQPPPGWKIHAHTHNNRQDNNEHTESFGLLIELEVLGVTPSTTNAPPPPTNDFIWAVTSKQSSFLVKRSNVVLSRDPLNVSGKNTKTSSGLVNEKAIGVSQENGKIVLRTKITKNANKPAKNVSTVAFNQYKSPRKVALAVSNSAKGYRDDLRAVAVRRASQYSRSNTTRKTYAPSTRA